MATLEDLEAAGLVDPGQRNGHGPEDPRGWLTTALGADAAGSAVVGAVVYGRGRSARVDVELDGGEKIIFEQFGDITSPLKLTANIVTQIGVYKKFTAKEAGEVAAAIFKLATHCRESTADDAAIEWGAEYLRLAPVLALDMADQMQRWQVFSRMGQLNPHADAGEDRSAAALAEKGLVLEDHSGMRFVRAGWFLGYVKREVGAVFSAADLAMQMEAVGWQRLNSQGRIKATSPTDNSRLSWRFYVVRKGWEDTGLPEVTGATRDAHDDSCARVYRQPAVTQDENRVDKPNSDGWVTTGVTSDPDVARAERLAARNRDIEGGFER